MAPSTAAAPDMSIFIDACMASVGFRLMPPESYMMPLPTSTRCPFGFRGRYVSLTMRGGSALPALTPSRPPQPRAASASSSNTSTSRPAAGADGDGDVGHAARREVAGRRVGEVAGEVRGARP